MAGDIVPTLPTLPRRIRTHGAFDAVALPAEFGSLHAGESSALALAPVLRTGRFLADDLRARQAASRPGFTVPGSVGIRLRAMKCRRVEMAQPTLDVLVGVGLYLNIDASIYQRALKAAEQAPAFS